MRNILAVTLSIMLSAAPARALEIFACEPEWGALATEIGGPAVRVFVATTAQQDPHQIQARPALIARLRTAGLVVCTGAELEVGWMPVLLRQSANGGVQPGSPGYFEAAGEVPLLEIPTRLDRSEGDVHAAGNPHVQTDPTNMRMIGMALARRMAQVDPGNAAAYQAREQSFRARLDAAIARWRAQSAPLKGASVAVQHKSWAYLLRFAGMTEAATLEPKPGVPASPGYLARLIEELPARHVRMILVASYQDPKVSEFVAARTNIPVVTLPFTVGGSSGSADLISFYDDTIRRLLDGLKR